MNAKAHQFGRTIAAGFLGLMGFALWAPAWIFTLCCGLFWFYFTLEHRFREPGNPGLSLALIQLSCLLAAQTIGYLMLRSSSLIRTPILNEPPKVIFQQWCRGFLSSTVLSIIPWLMTIPIYFMEVRP